MSWEITTKDGYTIRAFSTLYVDWGLEITKEDETGATRSLYYCPCSLSNESYGFHWEDEDGNEFDEGVEWTDEEWQEALRSEADDFLEAYLPEEQETA